MSLKCGQFFLKKGIQSMALHTILNIGLATICAYF